MLGTLPLLQVFPQASSVWSPWWAAQAGGCQAGVPGGVAAITAQLIFKPLSSLF